jgi:hypothetical protein
MRANEHHGLLLYFCASWTQTWGTNLEGHYPRLDPLSIVSLDPDVHDEGDRSLARSLPFRELSNTVPSKKSSSISDGTARFLGEGFTVVLLPPLFVLQGSWRRGGIV